MAPRDLLNDKLHSLLKSTIQREHVLAIRDAEILAIQRKHQAALDREDALIAKLTPEIEVFATANREKLELDGSKSVQLGNGLIGFRAPTNPALVPLNDKWSWEKIARSLKRHYKMRFFHPPAAPKIDKIKLKRELSEAELSKVNLRLDDSEHFYLQLNRLEQADSTRVAA